VEALGESRKKVSWSGTFYDEGWLDEIITENRDYDD
jgi:hypothetical protein